MKRIIFILICVVVCCSLLCQPIAAATSKIVFNPRSCYFSSLYAHSSSNTYTTFAPNVFLYPDSAGVFACALDEPIHFSSGALTDFSFTGDFYFMGSWDKKPESDDFLYLTFRFSYTQDVPLNFDDLLEAPISLKFLYDDIYISDYAFSRNSDNSYLLTFMVDASDFSSDMETFTRDECTIVLSAPLEPEYISMDENGNTVVQLISFNIYCEFTTSLPGSDPSTDTTGSSGSGGSGSGDSGSGDIVYDGVVIQSIERGNKLLEEVLASQDTALEYIAVNQAILSDIQQTTTWIENDLVSLQGSVDQLPFNIASEFVYWDLGEIKSADIPQDELDNLADLEDQLYDFSDSKVEYIGQSIDQLGNTLNSHIGQVSSGHDLFFTRVFEIDFVRDLVYISLGFGLVAFILRLGRKIQ